MPGLLFIVQYMGKQKWLDYFYALNNGLHLLIGMTI